MMQGKVFGRKKEGIVDCVGGKKKLLKKDEESLHYAAATFDVFYYLNFHFIFFLFSSRACFNIEYL